jgi:NAD(P)-dependent dehydrogenase (short-subunit alcohol dehydrogenase family)
MLITSHAHEVALGSHLSEFPTTEKLAKQRNMSLKGCTALVTGATGEVGRGAAYALSKEGAFVILAGRNLEKLQAIQDGLPHKLDSDIIAVDYSTIIGAKALEAKVQTLGKKLDMVMASSGPWWPVHRIAAQGDIDTLFQAAQANFVAHLLLYKVLAPHCHGQYLMITGVAGLNIAGAGLTGVLDHACVGASQLMHAECNSRNNETMSLPTFTRVMLSCSVGHVHVRGSGTNDPNEFGRVFVAMALFKHASFKDGASGTLLLDDDVMEKLVAML